MRNKAQAAPGAMRRLRTLERSIQASCKRVKVPGEFEVSTMGHFESYSVLGEIVNGESGPVRGRESTIGGPWLSGSFLAM